jgi:hypothetical protein
MKAVPPSEFRVRSSGFGVQAFLIALATGYWLLATAAPARTITLTIQDADRAASIGEPNPRASWAGLEQSPGCFYDHTLACTPTQGVLLRFPLDRIPPHQRIVNAQLAVMSYAGAGHRLYVWRLLADWGAGVCHLFRQTRPEKLPWAKPGARGPGVDRAIQPTRVVTMQNGVNQPEIDVTRDVQLWYTGAGKNYGWLLSAEDEGQSFWFYSFTSEWQASWWLRITFEPL